MLTSTGRNVGTCTTEEVFDLRQEEQTNRVFRCFIFPTNEQLIADIKQFEVRGFSGFAPHNFTYNQDV